MFSSNLAKMASGVMAPTAVQASIWISEFVFSMSTCVCFALQVFVADGINRGRKRFRYGRHLGIDCWRSEACNFVALVDFHINLDVERVPNAAALDGRLFAVIAKAAVKERLVQGIGNPCDHASRAHMTWSTTDLDVDSNIA
jgi:hypothetical protein